MDQQRPTLAGVEVREADLETQKGLHFAATIIRACAIVIAILAIWQLYDWYRHQPPGGIGIGVLVGDTVRLVVTAALLWAVAELADLMVKPHYVLRASRIRLARQPSTLREICIDKDSLPSNAPGERRAEDAPPTSS